MENVNQSKYFIVNTKILSLNANVYVYKVFPPGNINILHSLSMAAILENMILHASDVISQNSRNNADQQTYQ